MPDEPLNGVEPGTAPRPVATAVVTLFLYGCVMLGGGHGAAPLVIIMAFVAASLPGRTGTADSDSLWMSEPVVNGVLTGWAGAAVLLVAQAFSGRVRAAGTFAGVVLLTLSLFGIVEGSEAPPFTVLTAVPFGIAATRLLRETFAAAKK